MSEIKEIIEKKDLAKDWRSRGDFETKWSNWRRIMRVEADEDVKQRRKDADAPCIVDPFLFSIVQFIVSQEILSLFTNRPFARCIPAKEEVTEEDKRKAEILNALLEYQLKDERSLIRITSWVTECLHLGLSILKVTWDYDKDDVCLDHIDIKNYYPSPASRSCLNEDIPWCFHSVVKDIEDLKKDGNYININKLDPDKERISEWTKENTPMYTETEMKRKIRVWEYWTDEETATITEGGVLIRPIRENIYKRKPFILLPDIIVPHSLYSIGEVQPSEGLHSLTSDLHSLRLYNLLLTLMPPILVSRQANIEDEGKPLTNLKPGRVIRVDGDPTKAAYQFIFKDVTASTYAEIQSLRVAQQDATGCMPYARGEVPQRRETATAITSLQQLANIRFKAKLLIHSAQFKVLLGMIADFDQRFMSDEKIITVTGEKDIKRALKVKKEDIQGKFDYDFQMAAVDSEAVKGIRRRQLIELFQIILAAEKLPSDIKIKFLDKVLATFEDPSLRDLIPSEEEAGLKDFLQKVAMLSQMRTGEGTAPTNVRKLPTEEETSYPTRLRREMGGVTP